MRALLLLPTAPLIRSKIFSPEVIRVARWYASSHGASRAMDGARRAHRDVDLRPRGERRATAPGHHASRIKNLSADTRS